VLPEISKMSTPMKMLDSNPLSMTLCNLPLRDGYDGWTNLPYFAQLGFWSLLPQNTHW